MTWPTRAQLSLHPSRSLHSAPLPLHPSWLPQRAPCPLGATDIVDTEVGGDDSPLSSASPEVVRLPRWDDLGRSYTLNHNLGHKFIPNAFVIPRMVATVHYLHLTSQELHEALMEAHGTLGEDADERVRLREEGPVHEANARRLLDLTDQLSALTNQHQEAQAAAAFQTERARLAEWDAGQLRGQIGLVQQDLARTRNDLTAAMPRSHASDGPGRSVEGESSGGARGFSPLQPAGYELC